VKKNFSTTIREEKKRKIMFEKNCFFEKIDKIIKILEFSFFFIDDFSIFFLADGCAEIFFYAKLSQTSKIII